MAGLSSIFRAALALAVGAFTLTAAAAAPAHAILEQHATSIPGTIPLAALALACLACSRRRRFALHASARRT
jgi:hypothetical protein